MRIPRIYQPGTLIPQSTLQLVEQAAKHVQQVLRLTPGAELILFNGEGGEYSANIIEINKRIVKVVLGDHIEREVESPVKIHLVQAISRGEKMDFTMQKAVELGITHITPLLTERSQFKLISDRSEKKLAHWRAVIISACEQCGRNQIPVVDEPISLSNWLAESHPGLKLVLHPGTNQSLAAIKLVPEQVILLVGSEGGFSEVEIKSIMAEGFQSIALGPRILRTETAAMAAISAIQTLWGDFNPVYLG